MSFRHTYITEFLYKNGRDKELEDIKTILGEHGSVNWVGTNGLGYFYGVVRDLDGHTVKDIEAKEIKEKLAKLGVRIGFVFE